MYLYSVLEQTKINKIRHDNYVCSFYVDLDHLQMGGISRSEKFCIASINRFSNIASTAETSKPVNVKVN